MSHVSYVYEVYVITYLYIYIDNVSTANKKYQAAIIEEVSRTISEMEIDEGVVDLIKNNLTIKNKRKLPEIDKVGQCSEKCKSAK